MEVEVEKQHEGWRRSRATTSNIHSHGWFEWRHEDVRPVSGHKWQLLSQQPKPNKVISDQQQVEATTNNKESIREEVFHLFIPYLVGSDLLYSTIRDRKRDRTRRGLRGWPIQYRQTKARTGSHRSVGKATHSAFCSSKRAISSDRNRAREARDRQQQPTVQI